MKPAKVKFSTYRFRDSVAVYLATEVDPTHTANGKAERQAVQVYLTPAAARKLTRAINAAARNVETIPKFSESSFPTRSGESQGEV